MKNTTSAITTASDIEELLSPLFHQHAVSTTVTFADDYGITLEMTVERDGHARNRVGLSAEWYGEQAGRMVAPKTTIFGLLPLKREDGGICHLEAWQSPEHFRAFVAALQRLADELPYSESTIKRAQWGKAS